jgi:hypothetical protein
MPISSKSSRVSSPNRKIQDVPELPTITGVSENAISATAIDVAVSFSPFGGRPGVLRATSTPGNIQGISFGSSPITVNGLTPGTNYNFTVRAETSAGANRGTTALSVASDTPTGAVVPIATIALATSQANFIFSNIPQTFRDLYVVMSARATNNAATSNIYLNIGNTSGVDFATNYSQTNLSGNGSSAASARFSNSTGLGSGAIAAATSTSGIFNSTVYHVLSYASTTAFKTILSRTSYDLNGSGGSEIRVGSWRSAAGITTLQFGSDLLFAAGSTCTLYGIKAAS